MPPELFFDFVEKENHKFNYNWGAYFNCGHENLGDSKKILCRISPEQYLEKISPLISKSSSFIGACCGSSPQHIKKLKHYFDEINNN